MIKYSKEIIDTFTGLSAKELTDLGICPTCFDRQTGRSVFGDDSKLKFFEDDDIECLFVSNPRANGHLIITTKQHFHDMSDASDEINEKIVRFSRELMKDVKDVFGCERVYFCTMSDGPMNHYHVQLIPRYSFESRGSENFVKPRKQYVFDEQKFNAVKSKINAFAQKDMKEHEKE